MGCGSTTQKLAAEPQALPVAWSAPLVATSSNEQDVVAAFDDTRTSSTVSAWAGETTPSTYTVGMRGGSEGSCDTPGESMEGTIRRLASTMGDAPRVCVLGGTSFRHPDSEALVHAVSKGLATRLRSRAAFVTGGMPGVQRTFAEACGDGVCVWNLLPEGEASGYCVGKDLRAGRNLEQRMEAFGRLGDIYISVEGGPGVAQEANAAVARGAYVVPLVRTGGASAGMFGFPAASIECPSWADSRQWELLQSTGAPIEETAEAVVDIVEVVVGSREARLAPDFNSTDNARPTLLSGFNRSTMGKLGSATAPQRSMAWAAQ
eukprot:CAMPEP_0117507386 /NCGR_PEP_ID=MMETSP0784-20121206/26396_1 /TAXON_ID=39447 /ORGANISM="" /LENGTH=318 /DNA_ID=CAMNT_0005302887 /DNA_START=73 /DNA_END=1029 /DNA_ORIENTATION=-